MLNPELPLNILPSAQKGEFEFNHKCLQCDSTTVAIKQHFIDVLPEVLNIKINRMAEDGAKITSQVGIEEDLTVNTFFGRTKFYRLFAVISHIGTSITGGKFVTYINVDLESWWKFDSTYASKHSFVDLLFKYTDETPYSLIYVSKDLIAAHHQTSIQTPHITHTPIAIQTPQSDVRSKRTWPICKRCKKRNSEYVFSRRCKFCNFDNE